MKIFKIQIDAYVSAESLARAMDFAEDIDPVDWDSYTVHPPIEVVDYGSLDDEPSSS